MGIMEWSEATRCVCGSGVPYNRCCGPVHDGRTDPPTAERLMRARFAAYALTDEAYLLDSWHQSTRPPGVMFDPGLRWISLEILDTEGGGLLDEDGAVEFIARYRRDSREGSLQERSRFVRVNRRWTYVDAADADLT